MPIADFAYDVLMNFFHRYALIGGMPEIVAAYAKTHDVTNLHTIYDSLLISYQDDVGKYAKNSTMATILRHCIESAPYSAGKRITYAGFGQSGYRSREVGEALRILQKAMLIHLLRPSTSAEIPIVPDLKKKFILIRLTLCFPILDHFLELIVNIGFIILSQFIVAKRFCH